jgi:hypothetical protein
MSTGKMINRLPVVNPVISASFETPTISLYLNGVNALTIKGRIKKVNKRVPSRNVIKYRWIN